MEILVIDDEKAIPSLFAQRFKGEIKEGIFNFHFVRTSQEALDFLQNRESDERVFILSDIELTSGMNGLELLRKIKTDHPYFPVFIITAYDDDHNIKKAQDYGANDFIRKPIDFVKLRQKILDYSGRTHATSS